MGKLRGTEKRHGLAQDHKAQAGLEKPDSFGGGAAEEEDIFLYPPCSSG